MSCKLLLHYLMMKVVWFVSLYIEWPLFCDSQTNRCKMLLHCLLLQLKLIETKSGKTSSKHQLHGDRSNAATIVHWIVWNLCMVFHFHRKCYTWIRIWCIWHISQCQHIATSMFRSVNYTKSVDIFSAQFEANLF